MAAPTAADPRAPAPDRREWIVPTLALLFVLGMFAAVIAFRWRSQFSNVDDYLYALQTRAYLDAVGLDPTPMAHAWREFGRHTPLVPTLALPIAAVDDSVNALVLVQAVPLFVLLLSLRSLLGSLGSGRRAAWLAAALITTLPPVLGYAAMYHYSLAATACTVLAMALYTRSERLRRLPTTLLVGVALGALALARVVGPVYGAALGAAFIADAAWERDHRRVRARNGVSAALVAIAIAAPWWSVAGTTALRYVSSTAYGGQPVADPSLLDTVRNRVTWTATESGWLLTVVLAALVAWAIAAVIRRTPGWRAVAVPMGAAILGFAVVATDRNSGTANALPVVVLACCGAVWGIGQLPGRLRGVVTGLCVASLVVPALALVELVGPGEVGGRALWQVGPPGFAQARGALGCRRCAPPDSDRLAGQVLDVVGDRPVLTVREDVILNSQGLRYAARRRGLIADIRAPGPGEKAGSDELSHVDYVIVGGTLAPYLTVDQPSVLVQLAHAHFHPVFRRNLSPSNSVVVVAAPRFVRG